MNLRIHFMQPQTQPTPIPIEHGIPISWRTAGGFGTAAERLRQTFARMKPMDSIKVEKGSEYREAYRSSKQVGAIIVSRKLERGGWRIWRVQ